MLRIGEFAQLAQVSPRTLRHYASLGLLEPSFVDAATGYRLYELGQLADLRRILALRDLGFGLDTICELLAADGELSVEHLRGMLMLRRAELVTTITEQTQRLERVAMLLDGMEKGIGMRSIDVAVRTAERVRLAETSGTAAGYGPDNIRPVFESRLPVVREHLVAGGFQPGIRVAHYDWPDDDGRVVVHLGFEIDDQAVPDAVDVRVVDLPSIPVACALHRGPIEGISDTFEAIVQWIDANGYEITDRSRELYLQWTPGEPGRIIVELQIPIRQP